MATKCRVCIWTIPPQHAHLLRPNHYICSKALQEYLGKIDAGLNEAAPRRG